MGKLYFFILGGLLFSCSPKVEVYTVIGATMGTSYSLKIASTQKVDTQKIKAQVDDLLKNFNLVMSTYIPSSEISQFNQDQTLKPYSLSSDFTKTLETAKKIFHLTGGAYDVSVGPLVNRWSFGPEKKKNWSFPLKREIRQLQNCVGMKKFRYFKGGKIQKVLPCQKLDFSSLAKGQGIDKISDFLLSKGLKNHMVEIGGEVKVMGDKGGKSWKIGIESPKTESEMSSILKLETGDCVATSGGYKNFFTHNGERYSHTIDPRTGFPITHKLRSVTVKMKTCLEADAWATAFMVLGVAPSFELAKKEKIWVRLIFEKEGRLQMRDSMGAL